MIADGAIPKAIIRVYRGLGRAAEQAPDSSQLITLQVGETRQKSNKKRGKEISGTYYQPLATKIHQTHIFHTLQFKVKVLF